MRCNTQHDVKVLCLFRLSLWAHVATIHDVGIAADADVADAADAATDTANAFVSLSSCLSQLLLLDATFVDFPAAITI